MGWVEAFFDQTCMVNLIAPIDIYGLPSSFNFELEAEAFVGHIPCTNGVVCGKLRSNSVCTIGLPPAVLSERKEVCFITKNLLSLSICIVTTVPSWSCEVILCFHAICRVIRRPQFYELQITGRGVSR
jgi:hypothetical protein